MTRLLYATLVGLVGAAVVHLSVIFLLPLVSIDTAWNRIAAVTAEHVPYQPGDGREALAAGPYGPDPFFATVICRYDLRGGALHVRSNGLAPLWTVGIHDSLGTVIFSANDRLVAGRQLDLAVVDASQLRFVRQNAPPELANAIIAPAARPTGFVVVRLFLPDPTWNRVIENFADGLACEPLDF